jgi:glycosyltransferase involved in cell wall biosynthesis
VKIAVNTRLLLKNRLEGIGWFSYETLKRITTERSDDEFIFIFDRPFDSSFIFSENIKPIVTGPPSRHPFLWYIWFERSVKSILDQEKPDLFLSPDGYLSLASEVPGLPVIHDLNFEHNPGDLPFWYRKYYQHYFPRYAHAARRIATVSEFSKQDIVDRYHIAPDKIDVVYNGVSQAFKALTEKEKVKVRNRISSGRPYFLYLGALNPRKNITRMLEAFDAFKQRRQTPHKLVIAGRKMWWTRDMEKACKPLLERGEVVFIENLESAQIPALVGSADALLYVSTFEGFGIPIIEAQRSETPVITSNSSSMPEVAGKGALIVDPYDITSIENAMHQIISDASFTSNLIEEGRRHCQMFSWQQTAQKLSSSIDRCFGDM